MAELAQAQPSRPRPRITRSCTTTDNLAPARCTSVCSARSAAVILGRDARRGCGPGWSRSRAGPAHDAATRAPPRPAASPPPTPARPAVGCDCSAAARSNPAAARCVPARPNAARAPSGRRETGRRIRSGCAEDAGGLDHDIQRRGSRGRQPGSGQRRSIGLDRRRKATELIDQPLRERLSYRVAECRGTAAFREFRSLPARVSLPSSLPRIRDRWPCGPVLLKGLVFAPVHAAFCSRPRGDYRLAAYL